MSYTTFRSVSHERLSAMIEELKARLDSASELDKSLFEKELANLIDEARHRVAMYNLVVDMIG